MAKKKKTTKAKTTKATKAKNAGVATAVQGAVTAGGRLTTVEFSREFMKAKDRKLVEKFNAMIAQVQSVFVNIYDGRQGDEHPELRAYLQSYGRILSMAAEMNQSIQGMKVRELT